MNTFAVVLLAFPFYLATKGKLAQYVALAKATPGTPAAGVTASTPPPSTTGVPASAANAATLLAGAASLIGS
jgi:hypothetical protein